VYRFLDRLALGRMCGGEVFRWLISTQAPERGQHAVRNTL
jgi:hypothetical protein